ncbi:hypothetical protein BC833DRAFT_588399 [Globomyces pollinis-pini]|nr:hypothetical protein BC833DRAFT_588399 [Globomyces pollinis-pini]
MFGGGFGNTNNTQPNLFGSKTTPAPTTGFQFGQPAQQQPAFGGAGFGAAPTTTTGFGSTPFSSTPFGASGFQAQQPAAPAFGANTSTFGGFGQTAQNNQPNTQNTGFGTFGAPTNTAFGSTAPSAFGAQPTAFGGQANNANAQTSQTVNNGTGNPAWTESKEREQNAALNQYTHYQAISAMPQYKNWSFEELRFQDYQMNKKGPNAAQPAGGFGAATNTFGQPSTNTFGAPSNTGFGTNTNTGFGAATNTTGGFGTNTGTGFGATSTAFGASNTTGGFGTSNTNTGFGATNTSTFGAPANTFGATNAFGTTPATTGFGAAPTTSAFGTTPATTGFGAPAANTGFGAAPATTGFGTTNTGFGGTAATSAFGATNTNTGFGFGAKPATTGFGASATTTGFGAANNAFGKPATTGFGTATTPATTGFGAPAATGFGAPATTGFGAPAANTFGAPSTTPATTGFGTATNAFGAKPATSGFSFGSTPAAAPTTNTFGQPATNSLFGNTNAAPTTGFGTAQPAFGANTGFQTQNTGLFGNTAAKPATTTGFGFGASTTATQPGFGQTQSMFGAAPQQQQGPVLHASLDKPYGFNPILQKSTNAPPPANAPALLTPKETKQRPTLNPNFKVTPRSTSQIKLRGVAAPTTAPALAESYRNQIGAAQTPSSRKSLHILDGSPRDVIALGLDTRFTPRRTIKRLELDDQPSMLETPRRDPNERSVTFDPALEDAAASVVSQKKNPVKQLDFLDEQATPIRSNLVEKSPQSIGKSPTGSITGKRYTMKPSLLSLMEMSDLELSAVKNFTVSITGIGSITFLEKVNLLDASPTRNRSGLSKIPGDIVLIEDQCITVYPNDAEKPVTGFGLNVKARLTLWNCFPRDKRTNEIIEINDPRHFKHVEKLRKMVDTEFIDYDNETGVWVFEVDHF